MNPKLTTFLSEHPDMTLIGFAWSTWWRIVLVVYGVAFVIGIFAVLVSK
jgi:hypothetical protein